jgi:outer membrane biosynthesis protein TonB
MHANVQPRTQIMVLAISLSIMMHGLLLGLFNASPLPKSNSAEETTDPISLLQVSLLPLESTTTSQPLLDENRQLTNSPATKPDTNVEERNLMPVAHVEYFTLAELEQPPQMLQEINTNPSSLNSYKEGGIVKLRLWIDEQGNVVELKLVESLLPAAFIENAMESFRIAKFTAGIKSGHAVRSVVTVVVNYESA